MSVEWRERWNYQNFKLQLLTDMWVLREIELECLKEGHPANLGDESILAKTASMSSCPSPTHTAPPAIGDPFLTDDLLLLLAQYALWLRYRHCVDMFSVCYIQVLWL